MNTGAPLEGCLDYAVEPGCHALVLSRLAAEAERARLTACEPGELRLVVEEVLTNVVKYSGAAESGARGRVRWRMWPDRLDLEFEDPGRPFDPLGEDRNDRSDEERCEGGMGILLVQALARSIRYTREGDRNRLCMTFTSS